MISRSQEHLTPRAPPNQENNQRNRLFNKIISPLLINRVTITINQEYYTYYRTGLGVREPNRAGLVTVFSSFTSTHRGSELTSRSCVSEDAHAEMASTFPRQVRPRARGRCQWQRDADLTAPAMTMGLGSMEHVFVDGDVNGVWLLHGHRDMFLYRDGDGLLHWDRDRSAFLPGMEPSSLLGLLLSSPLGSLLAWLLAHGPGMAAVHLPLPDVAPVSPLAGRQELLWLDRHF